MFFFPFQKIRLTTKLSIEEVLNRLSYIIDTKSKFFGGWLSSSNEPDRYSGSLNHNRFELYRGPAMFGYGRIKYLGTIQTIKDKTIIDIEIGRYPFTAKRWYKILVFVFL